MILDLWGTKMSLSQNYGYNISYEMEFGRYITSKQI
jgi:hypothetical protein